jgi:hypothetical protein
MLFFDQTMLSLFSFWLRDLSVYRSGFQVRQHPARDVTRAIVRCATVDFAGIC